MRDWKAPEMVVVVMEMAQEATTEEVLELKEALAGAILLMARESVEQEVVLPAMEPAVPDSPP